MPGWLLRPPGAAPGARRPTVIFNNGHDAQLIGLYVYGAAEAVALGYNALLFEGPGQGAMPVRRGIAGLARLGSCHHPGGGLPGRPARTSIRTGSRWSAGARAARWPPGPRPSSTGWPRWSWTRG